MYIEYAGRKNLKTLPNRLKAGGNLAVSYRSFPLRALLRLQFLQLLQLMQRLRLRPFRLRLQFLQRLRLMLEFLLGFLQSLRLRLRLGR